MLGNLQGESKRSWRLTFAVTLAMLCSGCFSMHHTVGDGPVSDQTIDSHQWHALWGVMPIGENDSTELTGNLRNYRLTTQFSLVDVLLSSVTSFAGFYRQTVTVEL